MKKTRKTEQITFKLTPEMKQRIRALATEEDIPAGHLIRRAIQEWMDRQSEIALCNEFIRGLNHEEEDL